MDKFRVKNWEKFQHFKNRRPPWIKLYRDLLDDPDFHELSGMSAKVLVMLWLLASEDKSLQGYLPDIKTISFRLRMSEREVIVYLQVLHGFIYHPDIKSILSRYQDDTPETETETETETEKHMCVPKKNAHITKANSLQSFEHFWSSYPRKTNKQRARLAWKNLNVHAPPLKEMIEILEKQKKWDSWKEGYIPHASTWLNGKRWEDQEPPKKKSSLESYMEDE